MNFLRSITGFLVLLLLASCSNQNDKFVKPWKATEVTLNGGPALRAEDLGGIQFVFNADGTFDYTEGSTSEKGTWLLSDDAKEIYLKYKEREVKAKVIKQEDKTLVLEYEDHGMQRLILFNAE